MNAPRHGRILIVDDEPKMREVLALALESSGHQVDTASDGAAALRLLEREPYDLVLSDLRMPGVDGTALLATVRQRWPTTPVVILTGHATLRDAVAMIKDGAFDYIGKPFEIDEVEICVSNALSLRRALGENQRLREAIDERFGIDGVIGADPAFQPVLEGIRVAAGARSNVLLTGESGSGKEVVARAIHYGGARRDGPFVVINCAAIPAELLESELFGHVKGAFTGALAHRTGHFAAADGGTLFLDEIGDMPLAMQAKILRVLQDRLVTPVGGSRAQQVDVRIIAATNRDLEAAIQQGQFRSDLYYRLNVFALRLPALRERPGDILLLAEHLLARLAREMGRAAMTLAPAAAAALRAYAWPGNVRELSNAIERALITAQGRTVEVADLPEPVRGAAVASAAAPPTAAVPSGLADGFDLDAELERIERALVEEALRRTGGVQVAAARLLGIKERSLWHRIKKLGIRV